MDKMQRNVRRFHEALRQSVGNQAAPALVNHELRVKLIEEEAKELIEAIQADDLPHAIKEACDLVYVTLGAMVEAGVDLAPFFAAVHASNMAKLGGPVREDGKALKPEGWQPPDIEGILRRQIERAKTWRSNRGAR